MSDFGFSNCLHCSKLVCLDCKDKHRVEFKNKIEKSISILNEKCNKFIGRLNLKFFKLNLNILKIPFLLIVDFKCKIKEFLLSSNNTKHYLSNCIEEIINELRAREQALLNDIDHLVNEKLSWFNKIQDAFIDMNTKVHEFLDESSSNLNG